MATKNKKRKTVRPARIVKRSRPAPTSKRSRPVKPARKVRRSKPVATVKSSTPTQQRLWLMYPPRLIQEPLVWQLGRRFKVTTNIRQASVTDEIGIVCLEVDGKRDAVKASIKWLEKMGVNVEPVEINVIES